jgi:diacylglycerol kinase (ATP)
MRTILIHNPNAGGAPGAEQELLRSIIGAGHETECVPVNEWRPDVNGSAEAIVVAGGDGTVRHVFTRLAGSDIPAIVLPLGSANNIARSLGASPQADVAELAAGWHDAHPRRFDLIDVVADDTLLLGVESVGVGLFAEVIRRGSDSTAQDKLRGGLTVMEAVVQSASPVPIMMSIDNGREITTDALAIEAMNVSAVGPAVPLAPHADPSDELLDIVRIGPEHADAVVDYVAGRLADHGACLPSLAACRARTITLRTERPIDVHVDDELVPNVTDLSIHIGRTFLNVLVR